MHTDHAEDQKKLFRLLQTWKQRCEWEKRGEKTILKSTPHELLDILFKVSQDAIIDAGGIETWKVFPRIKEKYAMMKPFTGLPLNWEKLNLQYWMTVRRRILIS